MTKSITIYDFLTEAQVKDAMKLYETCKVENRPFADACCDQIIRPNMAEINRKLGQENDPKYLAYAIEHVMNQASSKLQ